MVVHSFWSVSNDSFKIGCDLKILESCRMGAGWVGQEKNEEKVSDEYSTAEFSVIIWSQLSSETTRVMSKWEFGN